MTDALAADIQMLKQGRDEIRAGKGRDARKVLGEIAAKLGVGDLYTKP